MINLGLCVSWSSCTWGLRWDWTHWFQLKSSVSSLFTALRDWSGFRKLRLNSSLIFTAWLLCFLLLLEQNNLVIRVCTRKSPLSPTHFKQCSVFKKMSERFAAWTGFVCLLYLPTLWQRAYNVSLFISQQPTGVSSIFNKGTQCAHTFWWIASSIPLLKAPVCACLWLTASYLDVAVLFKRPTVSIPLTTCPLFVSCCVKWSTTCCLVSTPAVCPVCTHIYVGLLH